MMSNYRQQDLFRPSLDEKATAWIDAHPDVYERFKSLAYRALHAGRRVGAKRIAEVLRWENSFASTAGDGSEYAINNSYVSRMVRRLIDEDQRFRSVFETRQLKRQ
jgi:hypothetical protein